MTFPGIIEAHEYSKQQQIYQI